MRDPTTTRRGGPTGPGWTARRRRRPKHDARRRTKASTRSLPSRFFCLRDLYTGSTDHFRISPLMSTQLRACKFQKKKLRACISLLSVLHTQSCCYKQAVYPSKLQEPQSSIRIQWNTIATSGMPYPQGHPFAAVSVFFFKIVVPCHPSEPGYFKQAACSHHQTDSYCRNNCGLKNFPLGLQKKLPGRVVLPICSDKKLHG